MPELLDPEDAKIVTLVRDADGRTYAAASVDHRDASLAVSALRAAVVAAAASGARRFEAAAVVTDSDVLRPEDLAMLAEFTPGAVVFRAGPDGVVREQARA